MNEFEQDLEYAKQVLADPTQYNRAILDIAMDAGFYEVKHFNAAFKDDTHMTPIEYRAFHTQFKRVTGMTPEEYEIKHG